MFARLTRLLLAPAALALALGAAPAGAQEFPPPEEAARLGEGEAPRAWSFPVGVGVGYGLPFGTMQDNQKLGDVFGSMRTLQIDAGIAYRGGGISLFHRRGFGTAGDDPEWCPPGETCDTRFDATGGMIFFALPTSAMSRVRPRIGIGFALDTGEVKDAADTRRAKGWELFEFVSVSAALGDVTSRVGLGGFLVIHMMSLETYEPQALKQPGTPVEANLPIFAEVGIRLSFD